MSEIKTFVLRGDSSLDGVKRGLYAYLQSLKLESPKQVCISNYKQNKTKEQESSFHMLCGIFGNETGYTKDEIKEMVKKHVLGTTVVSIAGYEQEVTRPSSKAKRDEYSELIEGTYRLAAEAGVLLPELRREG